MQEVACTAFRLVPKVVTLNDLERRNDLVCVISPNSVALAPTTSKWLKLDP